MHHTPIIISKSDVQYYNGRMCGRDSRERPAVTHLQRFKLKVFYFNRSYA